MKFQISKGKNRNRFIYRERLKKLNLYNLFGVPPSPQLEIFPFLLNKFGKFQQKDLSSYVWKYQLFFKPSLSWGITTKFSWYNVILTLVTFIHTFWAMQPTVHRIDVWYSLVRNVLCRFGDFCTAIKPVLCRVQLGWASKFLKFMNLWITYLIISSHFLTKWWRTHSKVLA